MYSEWDGLSRWAGYRKKRPGIWLWNGMQFPVEGLGGKCDPEFAIGVGWSFPTEPQAETAFHSGSEFWDMLSGCKKGHMTWPSSYMCCGCSHEKPRLNTEASARAARNVRFIASSARKGGHLMWPPSCAGLFEQQTFPAPPPAADSGPRPRYLILVVPGARLGSVSLASVWKCSVYTFLPSRNIS